MVLLGFFSRVKGLITVAQKDGTNNIVFHVLFPILIFHILCEGGNVAYASNTVIFDLIGTLIVYACIVIWIG